MPPLWDRLQRWRADRALRRVGPDPQRILWALQRASEPGKLAYLGALNRHAALSGGTFLPDWMRAAAALQAGGAPIPERESTQWPAYGALGRGRYPGLTSVPKPTPVNLRRFSEVPPARRCIDKTKGAITRLDWQIKPLDPQYLDKRGNRLRQLPIDLQGRIEAAERAFRNPDPQGGMSWRQFIELVVEDILVGGFGAVETRTWPANPLQPFVLYPMDGMSVRINLDWDGDDSPEPDRCYRYCQAPLLGGSVSTAMPYTYFADRDLMYVRGNPRTFTPFGLGRLEIAFEMVNSFLGAWEARERFESNQTPPFGLDLGENTTPRQIDAFRYYWDTSIEGYGKIPITGGSKGAQVIRFAERQVGESQNAWPQLINMMIAISFGYSGQTIGSEKNVNRSTSETLQSEEFSDAVLPLVQSLEDQITLHVLHRLLGWTDLQFSFVISEGDTAKQVAIARELFDGDIATLNEARERAGMDPLPDEDRRGRMTVTEYRAWAQLQHQPGEPFGMQPTHRAGLEEQPHAPPESKPPPLPGLEEGNPSRVLSAADREIVKFRDVITAQLASAQVHAVAGMVQ